MAEKLVSLLNFDASERGGPKINSPRSVEACLRLGITFAELQYRRKEEFEEAGLLSEFVKQRHQHYENKRQSKLCSLRREREEIAKQLKEKKSRNASKNSAMQRSSSSPSTKTSQDLVLREQKRLDKLEMRQKKEFLQLLEYEIRMQAIYKANKEKQKRQEELEKQHERKKARRRAEWKQLRKQREEHRLAEEELEQKQQEELARRKFEEQQRLIERERQQEMQRCKEARRKEAVRRTKQAERQANVRRLQEEQEAASMQRQQEIDRREQQRQAVLERQRKAEADAMAAAAEATRKRMENVREKERLLLLHKQQVFEEKEKLAEQRRRRFVASNEAALLERQQKAAAHVQKIREVLLGQEEKLRLKEEEFWRKENEAQQRQQEICNARERERQRLHEIDRMKKLDRIEAIQRQQRAEEYRRKRILEQIDNDNQITEKLKMQAAQLKNDRRRIAIEASRKKAAMMMKVAKMNNRGQFNAETLMREFGFTLEDFEPIRSRSASPPTRTAPLHNRRSRSVEPSEANTTLKSQQEQNQKQQREKLGQEANNTSLQDVQNKTMRQSKSLPAMKKQRQRGASNSSTSRLQIGPMSRGAKKTIRKCGQAYGVDVSWMLTASSSSAKHAHRTKNRRKIEKLQKCYDQELARLLVEEQEREQQMRTRPFAKEIAGNPQHSDEIFDAQCERASDVISTLAKGHEELMLEKMESLQVN